MPNAPFRRGSKIGRNDPCPCGSGRKFKHCHWQSRFELPSLVASADLEKHIIAEGKRQFEKHKAEEIQRKQQQGLGRPIISTVWKGYRFVAVGNRMYYGKWKSFADFLAHYIGSVLGQEWANVEIPKPRDERHPVMQWYEKICNHQAAYIKEPGVPFATPITGAISAYYRLAYNLYLIAHNGKDIQTKLIARLKNKENFQGAFYETQVAAWLIKAGFELEYEDERDISTSHCEFTATYIPTGEQYSVEAKSRETKPGGSARTPVGQQLRKALTKNANHRRLVFLDLNKSLHSQEATERAMDRADEIIGLSEGMEIDGVPAPPAYVCVTNMNDQHALDTMAVATAVSFRGFKIRDFMGDEFPSILAAVRARERHWPMFELFKSIEQHGQIPQTFEGELPSEVFAEHPLPRVEIGELYAVSGPDGTERKGKLTDAVVMGDKAQGFLYDADTNQSFMATFPLSREEVADYQRHPDTFFGTYHKRGGRAETAMDLFDFFFDSFRNTPRDKLLELLGGNVGQQDLENRSQKELAEIMSERTVMSAVGTPGVTFPSLRPKRRRQRFDKLDVVISSGEIPK